MSELFIFTDQYPYGRGERSFIEPELSELVKEYDVTVISQASRQQMKNLDEPAILPEGVKVLHIDTSSPLKALAHAFTILFSSSGREEIARLMRDGFSMSRFTAVLIEFSRAKIIMRFCEREGIFSNPSNSVYYTFWLNNEALAIVFEKQKKPCIKWISRVHGYDLFNEQIRGGRQPFYEGKHGAINHLMFLSKDAQLYYEKNFGNELFCGQYQQIGLGVADQGIQPRKEGVQFRIVSCSNLIPLKRVELIAEALLMLSEENVEWVHFGDGPTRDDIQSFCEKRGVNAVLRGHVSNHEIIKYYQENYVDVFVTTSSSEGMPVSIEEALSFGIPIVATNVGGISNQVDGNGVLLPADPEAAEVAEAIKSIRFAGESEIDRMRRRSRAIWEKQFDSKREKEKLLALIKKVLDS